MSHLQGVINTSWDARGNGGILCAEVSIPEFMNKARGLLEQFRLHRCVKFPAAILLRYSQKVPSAWSGRTTKPCASKELLFWRQRSILANVLCVVDQGGFWWFPSSLDHSPRQGMELLKRRCQDSHGLGFAHFPYHRLKVIMSLNFEPVTFFSYKSVKVHYDHFMIITLQREAGSNIEEIRLEAARALCKAAEARNIIFHKCQWQQSLKNTWVQKLN